MNVAVEIYTPITRSTKLVPIEIQIRDKAMDLWAALEHIIGYKNHRPDPRVKEQFKHIAEILSEFDALAIELRDFDTES